MYLLEAVIKETHDKANTESLKLFGIKPHENHEVSTNISFAHIFSMDCVTEEDQ